MGEDNTTKCKLGNRSVLTAKNTAQSFGDRKLLMGKYGSSKLYSVAQDCDGSHNDLDLGVKKGDLVGVIQNKDPLGNRERWFCDIGSSKGFIQASMLTMFNDTDVDQEDESKRPVAVVAPYDEVAEDEYKKPTRRAPPVPVSLKMPSTSNVSVSRESARVQTNLPNSGLKTRSGNDQISVHSYEEITADSGVPVMGGEIELNTSFEPGCDLSPVYEEIPGGSRSSVSSNSGHSHRSYRSSSPRGKFYFAQYEFSPEEEDGSMVKVSRGQVVRVIATSGAGDWWYVEDRHATRGYVPASYLSPYYE